MLSKYLAAVLVFASQAAVAQSSCQAVYADAVRNVDVYSRVLSEQNMTFSEHCEINGSLKQASTGLDLTIPVKGLNVGFNGTRDEATQRMAQFCKSQAASLTKFDSTFRLSNTVVTDALSSYNQCIALEGKRIKISHVATDTRSLVVRVDLNPATDVLTLNTVQYDPRAATCRTNIVGAGAPVTVGTEFPPATAKGPFSVACDRTGAKNSAGDEFFPRLELLLDTNHGAYKVVMPTEGLYGFDTANATRQRILADAQDKAALTQENAALNRKLANPIVLVQTAVQGEKWGAIRCPQQRGNVYDYIKGVCKGISSVPVVLRKPGGNMCGYTTWQWTCTTYPE